MTVAATGARGAAGRRRTGPAPDYASTPSGVVGSILRIGLHSTTGLRERTSLCTRLASTSRRYSESRSTDTLSRTRGRSPLAAGDLVLLGAEEGTVAHRRVDSTARTCTRPRFRSRSRSAPEIPGFTAASVHALLHTTWKGHRTHQPSRGSGYRAKGLLHRSRTEELPSEGVVTGSIQVPPGGQPVVFLADHPVTGGYPVIAVVSDAGIASLAQLRPGSTITFKATTRPS